MTEKRQANRSARRRGVAGFTLLEALLVSLLVAALSIAVLQSLALAVRAGVRTRDRWRSTVQLWNRAVQARTEPGTAGATFRPMPSARPIRVVLVEGENPDQSGPWEVHCAEK